MMVLCALDLEGVLVPEIWIEVSRKTGIEALKLTTRDIPNYDVLMKRRLKILKENKIKLRDIQAVIRKIKPLAGAYAFLQELRSRHQVVILSDTFEEFAKPLMAQLDWPSIFCNHLIVGSDGFINGYQLRQTNGKEKAVKALKKIGYTVRAAGDSYNDLTMLRAADRGVLFNPPDKIRHDNPDLPVASQYKTLFKFLAG